MEIIQWREWGDAAFTESRETGKPVLLDISAVWCHWCHVMDETTYSDSHVIQEINEHFIPVRVDNDRNPDINSRYNMGGWPTTVFLTHTRDIITGATYVPPKQMALLLERISSAYSDQGENLIRRAEEARIDVESRSAKAQASEVGLGDVEMILDMVRDAYDDEFGGFGYDQKFPSISQLELLLFNYERTGDRRDLDMVVNTLRAMMVGEVFDPIEGGMFRYATHRDWTEPHYEKILDDNARVAVLLLDVYRITRSMEFLAAARNAFSYLETVLLDPGSGVFYGSQDADEEYYRRNAGGRGEIEPPAVDMAVYTDSNSSVVRAYLKLYGIAKDSSAKSNALRVLDYFNNLRTNEDGTVCHYVEDGEPKGFGNLLDHASLLLANLACYEATGSEQCFKKAEVLLESAVLAFGAHGGAFHDISLERANRRGLSRYVMPIEENSLMAICYFKIANVMDDILLRNMGNRVLQTFAGSYRDYNMFAADYAVAVALSLLEPVVVTVHTQSGNSGAERFFQAAMSACDKNCTIRTAGLDTDEPIDATICVGSLCRSRVTDPSKLADDIAEATGAKR